MFGKEISISNSAKKLVGEKGITDVTFDLRVMEPLALTTEGLWRSKRLALRGATIPL